MEEIEAICAMLEQLTGALLTALASEDVATVALIVQGREPLYADFMTAWERLALFDRELLAPRIARMLASDEAVVTAGTAWLVEARSRLLRMAHGATALHSYHAPFVALQSAIRH